MKKTILILLLINSIYANATHVQITFIANFQITITNLYPLSPSEGTATTDSTINTIFSNHNVNHCYYVSDLSTIIFADYTGSNLNSFISDLENIINVSKVSVCPAEYIFADRLNIKLYNIADGNPISFNSNNNVTTTNSTLNTIFDTYQVKFMNQLIPSSTYYQLYFIGNCSDLYTDLNNLNSVIENVEYVGVPRLLKTESFDIKKLSIYPNPFSSTFSIDTIETVSNYTIVDITGKQTINSNTKNELDTQISRLKSGIYILKLQFENGQNANYKLVKK